MPPKCATEKKHRLTLARLTSYDDILTDALVDHVYYWTTIRKNRNLYHASRGVREEDITSILQKMVIIGKNAEKAESELLQLSGLRKFMESLPPGKERDDFRKHMRRYINIYLPDCPFEITSTNRYTVVTHEASVTARRLIRKGETVKYLCGVQVIMTKEEEADINQRRRDFSIVVSSRNKSASLFLGPARFANHDCGANAELMRTGNAGMEIIAVRDIEIGDEITVTYGDNYFGEDNCECLCKTCEDNRENGWEMEDDDGSSTPVAKLSVEEPAGAIGNYTLRRRRSDFVDSSRTPSATPDLRPHVPKGTPKRSIKVAKEPTSPELSPSQQLVESNKKRERREESTPDPQTTRKRPRTGRSIKEESVPARDLDGLYSTPESSRASSVFESRHDTAHMLPSHDSNLTDTTSVDEDAIIVRPLRKKSHSRLRKDVRELSSPTGMDADTPGSDAATAIAEFAGEVGSAIASITELAAIDSDVLEPKSSRKLKRPSTKLLTKTLASTTKKRKYVKKRAPAVTDVDHAPEVRKPGDYVLTPLLLAQPASAWISCKICDEYFVQLDAYLTRSSCPRCERHSKLYGFQWPKTDKEGRDDSEERILDHRTIHRFIRPDEERSIRKRERGRGSTGSPEITVEAVVDTQERPRPQRLRRKSAPLQVDKIVGIGGSQVGGMVPTPGYLDCTTALRFRLLRSEVGAQGHELLSPPTANAPTYFNQLSQFDLFNPTESFLYREEKRIMSDIEITGDNSLTEHGGSADVEMGGDEVVEVATADGSKNDEGGREQEVVEEEEEEETVPARVTYVDHLKSPIVELTVGQDDTKTILSAHQALLVQSPFFEDACAEFNSDTPRRSIDLSEENLDAVGCFLEYLYTGEYFPQRVTGQRGLVKDPTMPELDETGEQLLKHARVYTLAGKFGVDALKALSLSKIHCVNSNAKGEIQYARYVYANTTEGDTTIRKPVASFWAHRSHVLRAEAEDEFRKMCLEFPQFGFDVLTRVLDEKLKNESREKPHSTPSGSSRKRQRHIQV
ncbi:hypothetical protein V494_03154 [Pseudogymnoascus sp. VKM F-4513 (FW-928)]|nr:hypothetical protein V494_03154 [Pseudogymnoascus sp. VKM F-4513 (FW-928)]